MSQVLYLSLLSYLDRRKEQEDQAKFEQAEKDRYEYTSITARLLSLDCQNLAHAVLGVCLYKGQWSAVALMLLRSSNLLVGLENT
jgi:hypothetical protein